MRYVFILLIICVLYSCFSNQPKNKVDHPISENDSVVDLEQLRQLKLSNPTDYRKVLDLLDQGDLTSLDVAGTILKNSTADTITRDSMFVVFNDFYNAVAGGYLENNEIVSKQFEKSPTSEAITKFKTALSSYGMNLTTSEGTFFLEPQNDYLLQNFGPALSSSYREYLILIGKEQKTQFATDGKILIAVDSLSSRIMKWEDFMTRHPDFISIKVAQDQYSQYLGAYLAGMDNSRVFNSSTNRLEDNLKMSFENFITKYPESKSAVVVKEYLDLLKTTDFNYTEKVDSFLLEKVYH